MPTSAIGQTASTATGGSSINRFAEMSSEEFLEVLMTELQNQDPLNPSDSTKVLEQLSSIRNIESQIKLNDQIEALVSQNQFAAAGGLIGKLVAGLDDGNNEAVGLVTSVRLADDKVYLELDTGQSLRMSRVTQIADMPSDSAT